MHALYPKPRDHCSRQVRRLLDAHGYYNRAITYESKGDNDRAIADYSEVIRLDPKFAPAYKNRGIAYLAKGDNDHATADYNDAIRLDPKIAQQASSITRNRGLASRQSDPTVNLAAILTLIWFFAARHYRGRSRRESYFVLI